MIPMVRFGEEREAAADEPRRSSRRAGGDEEKDPPMSPTASRPERGRFLRSRRAVATCVALAGVAAASVVAGASSATAADSYERGPAPTAAGLETNGSFAVS